jgi:hypothetical protein
VGGSRAPVRCCHDWPKRMRRSVLRRGLLRQWPILRRWLLQRWPVLRRCSEVLWTVVLRRWPIRTRLRSKVRSLPRLRHGRGWRSAILYSRPWLLCGPHLLRLETGTLGMAEWSKSLDPRPLRCAKIIELLLRLCGRRGQRSTCRTSNDRTN